MEVRIMMWYLCSIDNEPKTNAYLVQVIGESNMENMRTIRCADGVVRNLYQCPNGYADAKKAIAAIREFGLKLEVLKEGGDSVPVRFVLWKQPVRKKTNGHKRSALMPRRH